MAVLITGAAGFIGSACAAALASTTAVVGLDAFDTRLYGRASKEANLRWAREQAPFDFVETDIRDRPGLDRVFERYSFDSVIHLAAAAGVRTSIEQPSDYYDVNVTGTSRVLDAANRAGVRRFVVASSSSVYGDRTRGPFSESDPVETQVSPYAASKRAAELLATTFQRLSGADVTLLRFFTVYGPRQRPDMGMFRFMRAVSRNEPVTLFGDGSSARDYTFVDDIVDGVQAAHDHLDGLKIYNLGGDEVVELSRVIETIGAVSGLQPTVRHAPSQPGDVQMTMADLTRSTRELGYRPKTTFRSGIERMWDWYRRNRNQLE